MGLSELSRGPSFCVELVANLAAAGVCWALFAHALAGAAAFLVFHVASHSVLTATRLGILGVAVGASTLGVLRGMSFGAVSLAAIHGGHGVFVAASGFLAVLTLATFHRLAVFCGTAVWFVGGPASFATSAARFCTILGRCCGRRIYRILLALGRLLGKDWKICCNCKCHRQS